ncbi:MAG: sulfatase-like hydrolase/transferase [Planctomycetota bacterium]
MFQRFALLLCLILMTSSASAADRPNVLFIAVDDLNDWIGCMQGHPQALTPNMDRLAARGMLFTNAHCAAPACNPSRAAVFTGLMPNLTKVWSNNSGGIDKVYPGATYLPKVFSKAGYVTAGTGKLLHKRSRDQFQTYQSYEQRWSPFGKKAVTYTNEELPSKGSENPRHVLKDSRGSQVVLPINRMPSDRSPNDKKGESFGLGSIDHRIQTSSKTRTAVYLHRRAHRPGSGHLLFRGHLPLWH